MNADHLTTLMAQAKRDFRLHLIEQRPVLRALAERLPDPEAAEQLHQAAHQIYGTGGTLGFSAVATAAQALEAATVPGAVAGDITEAHRRLDEACATLEAEPTP